MYALSLFDRGGHDETWIFDGDDCLDLAMDAVGRGKLDLEVVEIWLSRLGDSELIFVRKPIRRNAVGEWEEADD
jgi:hypothetical protein